MCTVFACVPVASYFESIVWGNRSSFSLLLVELCFTVTLHSSSCHRLVPMPHTHSCDHVESREQMTSGENTLETLRDLLGSTTAHYTRVHVCTTTVVAVIGTVQFIPRCLSTIMKVTKML